MCERITADGPEREHHVFFHGFPGDRHPFCDFSLSQAFITTEQIHPLSLCGQFFNGLINDAAIAGIHGFFKRIAGIGGDSHFPLLFVFQFAAQFLKEREGIVFSRCIKIGMEMAYLAEFIALFPDADKDFLYNFFRHGQGAGELKYKGAESLVVGMEQPGKCGFIALRY